MSVFMIAFQHIIAIVVVLIHSVTIDRAMHIKKKWLFYIWTKDFSPTVFLDQRHILLQLFCQNLLLMHQIIMKYKGFFADINITSFCVHFSEHGAGDVANDLVKLN